jgi:hypothetical protein
MGCGGSKQQEKAGGGAAVAPPPPQGILLPQLDANPQLRSQEVAQQKTDYAWKYAMENCPPFVPKVPDREMTGETATKRLGMFSDLASIKASLGLAKALDELGELFKIQEEEPFQDWRDLFDKGSNAHVTKCPEVARRWMRDDEFAYQRLNGVNPTLIRKVVDSLPSNFPVTENLLKTDAGVSLINNSTFADLIRDGRLFICNYEELALIPNLPKDRFLYCPIALFWSNDQKILMPLAIQLTQTAGDPIFTPLDPKGCWLAAKIHLQVADLALHEVAAHLVATHIIMEAVYVSMMRNLHIRHPVNELLKQHFWYTLHINYAARNTLVSPTGTVPKVMALGYEATVEFMKQTAKSWSFKRYDIPFNIKRRGVDSPQLPNFHWRDDALEVWAVINKFATSMVNEFYADDAALLQDAEVQAWAAEMVGPLGETGCGFKGIEMTDNKFATRQQLVLFITGVLYNVSAGHSAVNNGQFDFVGFIPNMPGMFKLPIKSKVDISMKEIVKALPNYEYTLDQIVMVYILSAPTEDLLGSYADGFMPNRPVAQENAKTFKKELFELSQKLDQRDVKLREAMQIPYKYLNPNQIAQGIAI